MILAWGHMPWAPGNRGKRANYVQRNQRKANPNEIPTHRAKTSRRPDWVPREATCKMVARRALFRAVRCSSLIKGCSIAGNRCEEKKTPEKIHIGSITRFISPLTLSSFWARRGGGSPRRARV